MKIPKFETLDFCYDVIDRYRKDGCKYVTIFLQKTNKANKIKIINSDFTEQEIHEVLPSVVDRCLERLNISSLTKIQDSDMISLTSKKEPLNLDELCAILQGLNIEYVIISIKNGMATMSSYLLSTDTLTFTTILLSNIPHQLANGEDPNDIEEE